MTSPATAPTTPKAPKGWRFPELRRLVAILQRHVFLMIGSRPRLVEMLYWPTLSLMVWGFLTTYLNKELNGVALIGTSILGAVLLWEFMIRSQTGILLLFLEEAWSRNLGHLFVAPMPPLHYMVSIVVMSTIRVTLAMLLCLTIAYFVFDFWLPSLGAAFYGFALSLAMMGWSCSFILMAMLLRFGVSVEWLAWMAAFMLSPLVGVYYPVSVLPEWVQHISYALPGTYVFEGLRSLLKLHEARWDLLGMALLLNLLYLALTGGIFLWAFERTRRKDGLLHFAE